MFSLEKLNVYDKALASAASLARHSHSWDKRHAVTDQLLRAMENRRTGFFPMNGWMPTG